MKSKITAIVVCISLVGSILINTKSIGQESIPPGEIGVMCYSAQMPATPDDGYFRCGLCEYIPSKIGIGPNRICEEDIE